MVSRLCLLPRALATAFGGGCGYGLFGHGAWRASFLDVPVFLCWRRDDCFFSTSPAAEITFPLHFARLHRLSCFRTRCGPTSTLRGSPRPPPSADRTTQLVVRSLPAPLLSPSSFFSVLLLLPLLLRKISSSSFLGGRDGDRSTGRLHRFLLSYTSCGVMTRHVAPG